MRPRRTAAGLVLGAAGMIASRLAGRRTPERPAPAPAERETEPLQPGERAPTSEEVDLARVELADELARRSARADNSPR